MIAHKIEDKLRVFSERGGNGEKKKTNILMAVILAFAILLLGFSGCEKDGKEEKGGREESFSANEYTNNIEKQLQDILGKISGAGEVSVFIYVYDEGEKVLATDESSKFNAEKEEENNKNEQKEFEEKVVLSGGSAESPYVIKEKLPTPMGILVVAKGAKNKEVRDEIYDAVKATFGISAHRIKVSY